MIWVQGQYTHLFTLAKTQETNVSLPVELIMYVYRQAYLDISSTKGRETIQLQA